MALRYAANTGNWSALATWDGGASLPGAGDDVYANGKTVTIDQDVTVLSLRTTAGGAAVAGGNFAVSTARTITAEIIAGSSICLSASPGSGVTVAVTGNVTGSATAAASGVQMSGAGILNVVGNVTGGAGSSSGSGIQTATTPGTVNITGTVTGVVGSGVFHNTTGTMNITGDVTATSSSSGAINNTTGTLNVYGTATGSPTTAGAAGVQNNSTGSGFVQVSKSSDFPNGGATAGAPGTNAANTAGFVTVDAMIFGSGGIPPCTGRHFIRNAGTNYVTMRESNAGATLNMGELSADYPSLANVRSGISYDFGNKTGTCAVPPAGSVAYGVPVDATTGTAALSPTDLLGATRLARIDNCATVQSTGDQLAALGA
jgi:hypothetical protein